jgi:hypothetical protein
MILSASDTEAGTSRINRRIIFDEYVIAGLDTFPAVAESTAARGSEAYRTLLIIADKLEIA